MNILLHPDYPLLDAAIGQFRDATGLDAFHIDSHANSQDLIATFQGNSKAIRYVVEIKRKVDRYSTLSMSHQSSSIVPTLLVCEQMTHNLAMHCRTIGQQYIDTAGNAFITDDHDVFIFIAGRKAPQQFASKNSTATLPPAALRLAFAYLSDRTLIHAPYRHLSEALNMSVGAVSNAVEALSGRGFLVGAAKEKRGVIARGRLLEEWAAGYLARIRPKFIVQRFSSERLSELDGWKPSLHRSAWSGEKAADLITKHLKPAFYTIYVDTAHPDELASLVKQHRLRADPNGNIEILQPFWNMAKLPSYPGVPLPIIYADLLSSLDPRNINVASEIYQRVLDDAIHTP